MNLGVQEVENR